MSDLSKTLYLIPAPLGESDVQSVLPALNFPVIHSLKDFAVEEVRTARRFLRACSYPHSLDTTGFYLLNEHSLPGTAEEILLSTGDRHLGLISEAGLPAVADPGAELVEAAHLAGMRVVPLIGPSSLMLALMASGLNGQCFAFHGYLPVKPIERENRIRYFEKRSEQESQAQIFIEAPYRNRQLFEAFLSVLKPDTRVCVAVNLSLPGEQIYTASVTNWKLKIFPDIHKKPTVFIFQA